MILNKQKNAPLIGLMGVGNEGKSLYSPSGKFLFKSRFASQIQKVQHFIARKISGY